MDTTTDHPLQAQLAATIRRYRERRGLTPAAAAALAGLSEIAWRKYESGDRWPRGPAQWQGIADALRVTPASLLLPQKNS